MRFDPCEYCSGTVRARKVTIDLRRDDRLCTFQNVPVGVCTKCGQRYYPGRVLERLDEITRHGLDKAMTVRVPSLDFTDCVWAARSKVGQTEGRTDP